MSRRLLIAMCAALLMFAIGAGAALAGEVKGPPNQVDNFFWELSLGLYMTFKGFQPDAVAALAAGNRTWCRLARPGRIRDRTRDQTAAPRSRRDPMRAQNRA